MKLKIGKFQEGGQMMPEEAPMAPEETPAPQGSADPLAQLVEMAMQALQTQDGQMALQVCDALVQLVQQAQGGAASEGEPVFKRGGKISYRIKH